MFEKHVTAYGVILCDTLFDFLHQVGNALNAFAGMFKE